MKTRLPFAIACGLCFLFQHNGFADGSRSSQLYTTMQGGGANGFGVIYTVNADGTNGTAAISFSDTNGANPTGNMVEKGNLLYGTCTSGGKKGHGVLFSFDPATNTITDLHDFDGIKGSAPRDLVLGNNGAIYGTTQSGGANSSTTAPDGAGVLYCFEPATNDFYRLIDFGGANGEVPQGLMQASNGHLYGMTRQGGANNLGVLFMYDVQGTYFRKLADFDSANGGLPTNCKLIEDNSLLYGMTTWGGAYNMGTVFSYDLLFDVYAKIHDFTGADGAYPSGTLMKANDGKIYGVSAYGGTNGAGALFNLDHNQYTDVHDFDYATGAVPFGTLTQGSDGLLYGTTTLGGSTGNGVIFSYDLNQSVYSVVSSSNGPNSGINPMSNVVELESPSTINELMNGNLAVYPNPTAGYIHITLNGFNPEHITVTDLGGNRVLETGFTNSVDISGLAAGAYFIQVTNQQQQIMRSRIIKQ